VVIQMGMPIHPVHFVVNQIVIAAWRANEFFPGR
jgi:hypothetical protein